VILKLKVLRRSEIFCCDTETEGTMMFRKRGSYPQVVREGLVESYIFAIYGEIIFVKAF
jgi:hypothetical protein